GPAAPHRPRRAPRPSMIAGPGLVAQAATLLHGAPLAYAPTGAIAPLPAGPAGDPTAIGVAAMRRASVAPGMQLPAQATNNTMVIGTPPGYKDRPPRKAWPFV